MHVASLGRVDMIPSLLFNVYKQEVEQRSSEVVDAFWELCEAAEEANGIIHDSDKSKYGPGAMIAESNRCALEVTWGQDFVRGLQEIPRFAPLVPRGRGEIANMVTAAEHHRCSRLPYQVSVSRGNWPYNIAFTRFYAPVPPYNVKRDDRPRGSQPRGRHLNAKTQVGWPCMYPTVMNLLRGKQTIVNKGGRVKVSKEGVTTIIPEKITFGANGRLILAPQQRAKPLQWEPRKKQKRSDEVSADHI